MTLDDCRALSVWAEETLPGPPAPPPATDNFITNRLQFMQAVLPARATDDESGARKVSVFVSILRGRTKGAMAYLADRACRELRWFPTPRECLDILADYREPLPEPTERDKVLRLCSARTSEIYARWQADPDPDADVPDQWIRIAVEQGTLRRLEGGSLVNRARYHGPFISFVPNWK